ncbi:unnamed protein product [Rotaria socialis]|uniref:Uncharacterized protein n=1 Tax=Rotaria socialis TaxID=392032 RepID=A0A819WEM8_9BILA|nr:unnamed protein product [Rotaria socialis]CAF3547578.1 unnamed protein product [Rotaria socialis]CAF3768600.1 unnamed protein product [Rotaria socialis]CAF4123348.1 unnamed protein product [Rotaria socialis]CAF4281201.1 unnamed protein product [Rotaria socialis]
MIGTTHESMFFISQVGSNTANNHDDYPWKDYVDQRFRDIPVIRVQSFEQHANTLYAIQKKYALKLENELREKDYRLLSSSQSFMQYACHKDELYTKADGYMLRTQAYTEITNFNQPNNNETVQHLLNIHTNRIKSLLDYFYDEQAITSFQYEQMHVERSVCQLDYLFFTPDITHPNGQVTFEPITISSLSPFMPICRYLHRLLAPIYYNKVACFITIDKGTDIIPSLEHYQQQGHLKPTTHLITLHMNDLYTSITHESLLKTLKRFLSEFAVEGTIQGMTHAAILTLTECLLHHQYFVYRNCIFRQVKGGGTGLYLIHILIEIYLFYWQQPLRMYQNQREIFVRCFDHLFLTWNEPLEKLDEILNMMDHFETSISYQINIQIKEIRYLEVKIRHLEDHTFYTSIYHDWKYEPFALPILRNTLSLAPPSIFRLALVRAVLCYSQLQDFDIEQQYIEYSFLFHRYSFKSIRALVKEFLCEFNATDLLVSHNQMTYDKLRQAVLEYRQHRLELQRERLDEDQKACIWYIHTRLKGAALSHAKRNPIQLLPDCFQNFSDSLKGIKLEIIGIPNYPSNTL